MKFEDIFPILNRPEYPKNPEAYQSALAWSLEEFAPDEETIGSSEDSPDATKESKPLGLMYRKIIKSRTRLITLRETRPIGGNFAKFCDDLAGAGLEPDESLEMGEVASSLLDALEGVRPDGAKGVAATPLTRSIAYLQNPVGVHVKAGPPNLARIVEQVYAAGSRSGPEQTSAALRWFHAICGISEGTLEYAIEEAIRSYVGSPPAPEIKDVNFAGSTTVSEQPGWLRYSDTPFKWFNKAWTDFCSEEWRAALPSRRWSDWASCILRTGISLAFLWECRFYRNLGRLLLDETVDGLDARDRLLTGVGPLLEWHEPGASLTVRDQLPIIRSNIRDGISVRTYLIESDLLKGIDGSDNNIARWQSFDGFADFLDELHDQVDDQRRTEISELFGEQPSSAKNMIETVEYSLLSRKESGRQADFYGLLARRSRRFIVVEPGEEWIVVLASMCSRHPGGNAVLKDVRDAFKDLGIGATRETIVRELERAGLTVSSHDADDAIEVWAGF